MPNTSSKVSWLLRGIESDDCARIIAYKSNLDNTFYTAMFTLPHHSLWK